MDKLKELGFPWVDSLGLMTPLVSDSLDQLSELSVQIS